MKHRSSSRAAALQPASYVWLFVAAAAAYAFSASATALEAPAQCPAGEIPGVTGSSQPCIKCDSSQAKCLGGALVLPAPGWWQASPTLPSMSRCPNPQACLGFPEAACADASHPQQALRQCHPSCNVSTPECAGDGSNCSSSGCSTATYQALQCTEGYSGNICAVCAPGFGPKGLLFRCSKCISQHAAAALFIVAMVVLLVGIRFWAFLAELENVELASASCTIPPAAINQPTPQHPRGQLTAPAAPAEAAPPPPSAVELAGLPQPYIRRQPRLSAIQQLPTAQPGPGTTSFPEQRPTSTWHQMQQLPRHVAAAVAHAFHRDAQHTSNGQPTATSAPAASFPGTTQHRNQHRQRQHHHQNHQQQQQQQGPVLQAPASSSQSLAGSTGLLSAAAKRLPSFWLSPRSSESVTPAPSGSLSFMAAPSSASNPVAAPTVLPRPPAAAAAAVRQLAPAGNTTQAAASAAAGSASMSASAGPGISMAGTTFNVDVSSIGSSSLSSYGSADDADVAFDPATAEAVEANVVQCASQPGLVPLAGLTSWQLGKADAAAPRNDLAQFPLLPDTIGWSDRYNNATATAAAPAAADDTLTASRARSADISGRARQQHGDSHSITAAAAAGDGIGASRSRPSDVLRCFLLFLQFWTILASMQLQWPPVIAQPLAALSLILAAGHAPPLSIDCLVKSAGLGGASGEAIAVARVVTLFCMPFVVLSVLLLLELAGWCIVGQLRQRWNLRRKPLVSFGHLVTCRMQLITLAAVFFFYPSLVRTCLQLFVCLPVHTGAEVQRVWAGYANLQCGSGVHGLLRATIGVVGVLFVCIGMPVGMAFLLLRSSSRLDEPSLLRFGSLLRCYKDGAARAWESMIMVQTAVCVAITVFAVDLGEFYQACLMNVVLTLAIAALVWITPYRCRRLQRLMVGGAICLAASSYVALVLLTDRGQDATNNKSVALPAAVKDVIGVLVVVGNLACVVWGVYEFLLAMDWQRIWAAVQRTARLLVGVCRCP